MHSIKFEFREGVFRLDDQDQKQEEVKEATEAVSAKGEKSDEASRLSEAGEVSSESTSSDVHEPDRTGSEHSEEAELEKPDQTSDQSKPSKPVSKDLEKIIESIEKLSVLELADLVHALEDRFGVSAAAPMAVAGVSPAAAGEPEPEQTTFNVILASGGANKIGAIKAVRELVPTLGLKEAKDLVEAAPKQVLEGVNKETANEAKNKLTAVGATVELQ